jgi:hypothetical protein
MSPTMAKTPDSALKDLAARLDEIAKLRAEIDRQFGKAAQSPAAPDPSPEPDRQRPLRLVAAKPPIQDGNEGSPE